MKISDWIERAFSAGGGRFVEIDLDDFEGVPSDEERERIRDFVAEHGGSDEELRAAFARLPETDQHVIKRTLRKALRERSAS